MQSRISCSTSRASVFESHAFYREDLQLVTSGIYPSSWVEKTAYQYKRRSLAFVLFLERAKLMAIGCLFLTDSDSAICPVTAGTMHQLYPSESRGAKVTSTQPPFTSAAPARPSATNAAGRFSSAQKTTIPGTLHQPLTPRTSTGPSTTKPPWTPSVKTPSVKTPTLPWEQPLKTMEGLENLCL